MNNSFETQLELGNDGLWQNYIIVPDHIAEALIDETSKRIIAQFSVNECTLSKQCALMKYQGFWIILMNQKEIKSLGVQEKSRISIQLQKDTSEYGLEMPEELETVLDQNEEAKAYFDALTKGKQRSLIYIVLKVKNTDSRIRKAFAIAAHLQESKGNLDFKKLNEWIKHYNNKVI